jgi:hypothetical protein
MDSPAQDKNRDRAYELWEKNGKPEGKEDEFWAQAERELQGMMDRGDPSARNSGRHLNSCEQSYGRGVKQRVAHSRRGNVNFLA